LFDSFPREQTVTLVAQSNNWCDMILPLGLP
jgi:hypothetical protein